MAFGLPNVSYLGLPAPALVPAQAGLGFRAARPGDLPAVIDHYGRLSPECRRGRFCGTLSAEAVELHARGLWERSALSIAAFDGPLWDGVFHKAGPIRALIEISGEGRDAEIGVSVEGGLRRRGVGTCLIQTAAWLLAPRDVARLLAYTTPDNAGMLQLARRLEGRIERSSCDVEIAFDAAALRRAYLRRRAADQLTRRAG